MTQAERGLFERIEQYLNPGEKAGAEAENIIREFDQQLSDAKNTIGVAHDYIRSALNLPEDAPRRFDFYAQEFEQRLAYANETVDILRVIEREKTDQLIASNIARAELEQRLAEAERDKARLDWLELQYVQVRTPLVYGSRENFLTSSSESDGEIEKSKIREKIDAALTAPLPENKE